MNINRYKEIIISIIIILVISSILGIRYFKKYEKIEIANQETIQSNKKLEDNSYYIENDGTIKYIEFLDKDNGYMYKVKDVAMGVEMGAISKTTDGGATWEEVFTGINERFSRGSQVKFLDIYLGFITMPKNGGDSCELYVSQDSGKTFNQVEVDYIELENTQFKWTEIYDFYNMPTKENGKYYLEIGQGADGDYNGGKSIQYYSYNGISWTTDELNKMKDEEWKEQFDKRVANRDENIFLKDFGNYQPTSSEIKISQTEAEKIANIGFIEAGTIGEAGEKENQTMRIKEVAANNFFIMNHTLRYKIYNNIKRKCYVFIRENDMGCGAMVYVDVTTGLIIGGQCYGD